MNEIMFHLDFHSTVNGDLFALITIRGCDITSPGVWIVCAIQEPDKYDNVFKLASPNDKWIKLLFLLFLLLLLPIYFFKLSYIVSCDISNVVVWIGPLFKPSNETPNPL